MKNNPRMGHPGRLEGLREWVALKTPYILVYEITGKVAEILHVVHSSRDWPQDENA